MHLYTIFLSKLPKSLEDFHPSKEKTVTFLNPHSYMIGEKSASFYKNFDIIAPDGMLAVKLLNTLKAKEYKVPRFSFDMTSVAPFVLAEAELNNFSIYFLGTKPDLIDNAVQNLKLKYPKLLVVGYRHGYFKNLEEKKDVTNQIIALAPKIIIIGMGTPLQEETAMSLKKAGFKGAIYTCGGFLHQTASNVDFYPKIVNKLNFRLPYRMITEKGVFRRSLKSYPAFCLKFPIHILKDKLSKSDIFR